MNNNNFYKQLTIAQNLKEKKVKQWLATAKNYMHEYNAEYLFHPKTSVVAGWLTPNNETGFEYDPQTLDKAIESIFQMADIKSRPASNHERIRRLYDNFSTESHMRIKYLSPFADKFELYPDLGKQIIADLNEIAKDCSDSETLEYIHSKIKHITSILKNTSSSQKEEREFM
jgi:hypothetical protein